MARRRRGRVATLRSVFVAELGGLAVTAIAALQVTYGRAGTAEPAGAVGRA